jgi:hypothetical protein
MSSRSAAARPNQVFSERSVLRAAPGDRFVVRGHHLGEPERDGEILEVLGEHGAPPYRVRWEDGHTSEVFPGPDAYVQHFEHERT